MAKKRARTIEHQRISLDGMRYVVLRETDFLRLCRAAGTEPGSSPDEPQGIMAGLDMDRESLAERLIRRRRASGLSQAALARRAGIRPETLNRIERGHTTPDFATVRKLVEAMNAAETE